MFLSLLRIDIGGDPERPRPGRSWLRNLYRVHQRLCMGFPSRSRREEDPLFLAPFKPEDFPELNCLADQPPSMIERRVLESIHAPRNSERGFLFRIEQAQGTSVPILVQSAIRPEWDYAFHNAAHFLAAPPQIRPFEPQFRQNQRLRFRLLANPVRKVSRKSLTARGEAFDEAWIGKDVPVPETELRTWLERRVEPNWRAAKNSEDKQSRPGFRVVDVTAIQTGYVYVTKNDEASAGRRRRSARYDGVLEVTDVACFLNTLVKGIGPGKAFGFGLLSVAPV